MGHEQFAVGVEREHLVVDHADAGVVTHPWGFPALGAVCRVETNEVALASRSDGEDEVAGLRGCADDGLDVLVLPSLRDGLLGRIAADEVADGADICGGDRDSVPIDHRSRHIPFCAGFDDLAPQDFAGFDIDPHHGIAGQVDRLADSCEGSDDHARIRGVVGSCRPLLLSFHLVERDECAVLRASDGDEDEVAIDHGGSIVAMAACSGLLRAGVGAFVAEPLGSEVLFEADCPELLPVLERIAFELTTARLCVHAVSIHEWRAAWTFPVGVLELHHRADLGFPALLAGLEIQHMDRFLTVDTVHVDGVIAHDQWRALARTYLDLPKDLRVGVDLIERVRGILDHGGAFWTSPLRPVGMGGDEGGGDRGEQSELGWDFHGDNHCTVCAAALVPWVGAFSRARSGRSCAGSL